MITEDEILQAANDDAEGKEQYASYRETFIRGVQWTLEQDRWVSVAERLPDFLQGVLIVMNTSLMTVGYRRQTMTGYAWQLFGDTNVELVVDLKNDFVTHWRPLPSPPKT